MSEAASVNSVEVDMQQTLIDTAGEQMELKKKQSLETDPITGKVNFPFVPPSHKDKKLAQIAGNPLMNKREQTLEEFQKEQKELDVLLLQAAMEEDRRAHEAEKERQGIVT